MEQKTEDQITPDDWEQHSDEALGSGEGDIDNLSKPFLGLNVDAPPFVPSFAIANLAPPKPATPDEENLPSPESEKQPAPGKKIILKILGLYFLLLRKSIPQTGG